LGKQEKEDPYPGLALAALLVAASVATYGTKHLQQVVTSLIGWRVLEVFSLQKHMFCHLKVWKINHAQKKPK
jgi:hypothetical protein